MVAQGRVDSVVTGDVLSEAFGVPVEVVERDGRWSARSSTGSVP